MVIAFILSCLIVTLFLGVTSITTNSASDGPPYLPYDPWFDVNDDGAINALDVKQVKMRFGSFGTPINKTALLLELQSRIDELEARVEKLENQSLPLGYARPPAYDSYREQGWVPISPGTSKTFTHNLNTTDVLVYMIGRYDLSTTSPLIHQKRLGGDTNGLWEGGAYWRDLTNTTIMVERYPDDGTWNYVRVMIWKIQESPS